MRLVIVEQDASAAGWLAPRLESLGIKVTACGSVDAALASVRRVPANAILVDLAADVGGPQVMGWLRSSGFSQPVLLLSARSDWRE